MSKVNNGNNVQNLFKVNYKDKISHIPLVFPLLTFDK